MPLPAGGPKPLAPPPLMRTPCMLIKLVRIAAAGRIARNVEDVVDTKRESRRAVH